MPGSDGPSTSNTDDEPLAEVVVPCAEVEPELAFFVDLGFALEMITPADDPDTAVVAGHGLRLRLEAVAADDAALAGGRPTVRLRILAPVDVPATGGAIDRRPGAYTSPGGARVEIVADDGGLSLPPATPRLELSSPQTADEAFGAGRAGMAYRDLLPDRQGGRYIASHIRIAEGGPVPDYVHHHRIRFQLIYCRRGWVKVVYQDQGPPFVMEPGDCVLQPPGIRHRVLEASAGLEVVELSSPARHDTLPDPHLDLPTTQPPTSVVSADGQPSDTGRRYGGQRFVRHRAADATWIDGGDGGGYRDLGIAEATDGLARVRVVRSEAPGAPVIRPRPGDELCFVFVDRGWARVMAPGGERATIGPGDAVALPPGDDDHALVDPSESFEALVVEVTGKD